MRVCVRARICSLSEMLRHAWTIELMLGKNGHMHIEAEYIVCRGMEAMISYDIFFDTHSHTFGVRMIRIGRLSCYAMRIYFVSISSSCCYCLLFFLHHSFVRSFIQAIAGLCTFSEFLLTNAIAAVVAAAATVALTHIHSPHTYALCVRISWKWKRAFVQSNLLRCE